MVCFNCLCFTSFYILNDVKALVARDAVVKRSGCDQNRHRAIRNDLQLLQSSFFRPIHHQHVVSVRLSEHKILGLIWLHLLHSPFRNFQILCIKSTKLFSLFLVNRSFGLNLGQNFRLNLGHGAKSSSNKSSTKHF